MGEVGRGLPDHLRKELNDLNLQMARMPFPHPSDPYAEAAEEQDRPANQQAQQEWGNADVMNAIAISSSRPSGIRISGARTMNAARPYRSNATGLEHA